MTYMDPFPEGTRISQEFRSSPGGFNPPGGHTGRDYAVPVGTPVRAAADGIIRNSGWLTDNYAANPWWLTRYGGDTLVLDCTDAFGRTDTMPTFVYAHLSNSIAEVGARVKQGQIIALSGNSGTATSGPHCHVERLNPGFDLHNSVYGRSALNFDEYFLASNGIAAMGEVTSTTPADDIVTALQKEADMALVITQPKGDPGIYIGNGIHYRRIPDVPALRAIQDMAKWGALDVFEKGAVKDFPLSALGEPLKK